MFSLEVVFTNLHGHSFVQLKSFVVAQQDDNYINYSFTQTFCFLLLCFNCPFLLFCVSFSNFVNYFSDHNRITFLLKIFHKLVLTILVMLSIFIHTQGKHDFDSVYCREATCIPACVYENVLFITCTCGLLPYFAPFLLPVIHSHPAES